MQPKPAEWSTMCKQILGRGVPRQPDGGWGKQSLFGGNSGGALRQQVFFLAGNRMTTVALKKRFLLKLNFI